MELTMADGDPVAQLAATKYPSSKISRTVVSSSDRLTYRNYVPSRTGKSTMVLLRGCRGALMKPQGPNYTLMNDYQPYNLKENDSTNAFITVLKKDTSVPNLQLAPKNCCNLHLPSQAASDIDTIHVLACTCVNLNGITNIHKQRDGDSSTRFCRCWF